MGPKTKFLVLPIAGFLLLILLWVQSRTPSGTPQLDRKAPPAVVAPTKVTDIPVPPKASKEAAKNSEERPQPKPTTSHLVPESVLKEILARHRAGIAQYGRKPSDESRFEKDELLAYREARLAALVFPTDMERLASKMALDRSGDKDSRAFGAFILYTLAGKGNASAVTTLLELVNDPDPFCASCSLAGVAATDEQGKYKSLYLSKAREGSADAFETLSRWVDQITINEMKTQLNSDWKPYAEEVLKRLSVMTDSRCEEHLEAIIRHERVNEFHYAGPWAIETLRKRNPIQLQKALRSELDKTFAMAKDDWKSGGAKERFEDVYVSRGDIGIGRGSDYDDYLVAFWQAGGKPTEIELSRLRTFGYACDPETRLGELLKQ